MAGDYYKYVLAYILTAYDFGYTWPWTYGHLVAAVVLGAIAALLWKRAPRWVSWPVAALSLWAFAGFLIIHFIFGFNRTMKLPAANFLKEGRGKVLDIGTGSGRAAIMVGLARPGVRLVALDDFSAQYIENNSEDHLRRNLSIAGINDRVEVLNSDMRQIPLTAGDFDGVVSTYAIDHLDRQGIEQTLREVARLLKPRGEFLLMVIHADGWLKFTYGPLLMHAHFAGGDFWPEQLRAAGLTVEEQGNTPGSTYYLCRKQ